MGALRRRTTALGLAAVTSLGLVSTLGSARA